jgi:hypothetical protein
MVIKRIGPMSVAKITGTLYAVMGLVVGAFFSLLAAGGFGPNDSDLSGFGMVLGTGAVVVFPILYGCIGFVATSSRCGLQRPGRPRRRIEMDVQ